MKFDPENNVVKLCAQGMNLEAEGNLEAAHQLFQEAWNAATNDFEAFTAAHFLARNQKNPLDNLKWNLEALHRATAVKEEGMQGHYPSLYLNVGKSYEDLGDLSQAAHYYQLAADSSHFLSIGPYGEMIKSGISAGLKRVNSGNFNDPILTALVNDWCARKDLKPLSFVLPAYVGNLGTPNDIAKLSSALSYLSATRCLPPDEQAKVDKLIAEFSA